MSNSQGIYADVLIITVTDVESRAVLQAFKKVTGKQAKSVTVGDRVYRDLGTIYGSKVFLITYKPQLTYNRLVTANPVISQAALKSMAIFHKK